MPFSAPERPASPKKIARLRTDLLEWFDRSRRDLPWRRTPTPYTVLVSEIMLQQTQVETVLPYYDRFLKRFPTVQELAAAEEEEVLRYWAGLGYYRRARNLHRTAKAVVEGYDGHFPSRRDALLRLPGIGEYTAGAVLSIAFDQAEPLVDGNVERVLSRLFAIEENLSETSGKKTVWRLAKGLVPSQRPGDFNQSLMELGALVCTPTQPKCLLCPVCSECSALAQGKTDLLPIKNKNRKSEKVEEAVLLLEENGRWLLTDRNEAGIYQGLWQFPWAWKKKGDRTLKGTAARLLADLHLPSVDLKKVHELKHGVTFRSISTCFFRADRTGKPPALNGGDSTAYRWATLEQLVEEALPAYQKRILGELEEED